MHKYLIGLLLFTNVVRADDTDLVHFAAHFGMSYAINTFTYGLLRGVSKSAHKDYDEDLKIQEMIFAASLTLIVGFAYKALEVADLNSTGQAMIYNSLGVAAANFSFVLFQW